MKNYQLIQERYLRDSLPVRLGGLAANLRRIQSFTQHAANREAVESLLVELQVQLARWQRNWDSIWADPEARQQVGDQSRTWSDQVLALSGLLR